MNKKIANNIIFGILGQRNSITWSFNTTFNNYYYGSEMNGLLSSYSNICLFSFVGSRSWNSNITSFVKPLASNDKRNKCNFICNK